MNIIVFEGEIKTTAYEGKVTGTIYPFNELNDLYVTHETSDGGFDIFNCLADNEEFQTELLSLILKTTGKKGQLGRCELGMQSPDCAVFDEHPFYDIYDIAVAAGLEDITYKARW